jgi:DNA polymerase-3 subunit gamma/tau
MSYIVLARKYRPQRFDDLIGQETVVKTLKNALTEGKIAHSYLFSGPRGIGKTSAARIVAKSLNCINGHSGEPCGECDNCRAVTESSSVDVLEIDGASNTGVDDVRELREAVKYAPSSGRYKVYIIDEVHMLSTQAFNALLKTIEEPPPHVIFIFATTEPRKVPPTIQSRCQHHAFRRISRDKIKEQLLKITGKENINISDNALEMVARAADGSMRDALTLLDQAYAFSDDIKTEELEILLGLPESEVIMNLSNTILTGDISGTLSIIKELTERGYDLRMITRELVEHFRNLAIVKITQDSGEFLELSPEEIEGLQAQAADVSIEQLTLFLTEFLRLENEVRTAINPRYTLELGLLRTSFIKGMVSIKDVLNKISSPEPSTPRLEPVKKIEPVKSETVKKDIEAISGSSDTDKNLSPPDKKELFGRLLKDMDAENRLLACKLSEARIINLNSSELTIGFNGGMSVLADSIRKNSSLIEKRLLLLSGNRLRLKIVDLPVEEKRNTEADTKKKVVSEPIVQNAIKIFNGSIVEIKSLEENNK